jgi:predicted dehydrogenase/GNAT superfamily N-acetyltransferase
MTTKINVGIVGACARGGNFKAGCDAVGLNVRAVCDINAENLGEAAERLGATEQYTDYEEMLDKSQLDAVIIGTPMQFHALQSIAALQRNIAVLCEVTAAVSIDECRQLVAAAEKSSAVYMMAENYAYTKPSVLIRELVRQGLFGTPYYAEGEYIHELKKMNEDTPWRRKWQTGVAGVTYCTHSLGPILQWMPGDRVAKVCCEDTQQRWQDPRGDDYAGMTPVMLCKTVNGALIKIRVDMLSDRPHAMNNHVLQGTDGAYESSRGGPAERGKIWLRALSEQVRWVEFDSLTDVDELAQKYLPEMWRNPPEAAKRAGHGGGDFFEILDFVNAVTGKAPCPIGIHEAMDMTLPGLVSQQSVLEGGRWIDVPDSRQWSDGPPKAQLKMAWPQDRLDAPPEPTLPAGYVLRGYRDTDKGAYLALMVKVGFEGWDAERLQRTLATVLPDGLFVIEHKATGALAATALCNHSPTDGFPYGGELGWVAGDPAHKGKGLGMAICAAATARFIQAGYRNIYLRTDDWRLPALKIYLKLGYRPVAGDKALHDRWKNVFTTLNWHEPVV